MGYIVSSLASSKYDLEGYCIYLVKDYDLKGVSRDLVDSFDDYADSLKGSSAIFRPTKHSREKFEKRGRRLDTVKRAWQTNPQGAFE